MLKLFVVLLLSASVVSESVRETETWMPMKSTQKAALSTHSDVLESSGDSLNGSDFGFTDENDDEDDEDDDYLDYSETPYDDEDEYEFSGSGDGATTVSPGRRPRPSFNAEVNDNQIPDLMFTPQPTVNEVDIIQKSNEIPMNRNEPANNDPSNVLMSHTGEESFLNRKEFLAALIAACAVCLMFAIIPIALLIYCMKKKDEGSYDLGKKPIYKKAPTTEIFA